MRSRCNLRHAVGLGRALARTARSRSIRGRRGAALFGSDGDRVPACDTPECRPQVADRPGSVGNKNVGLARDPESRIAVVRAADVVIVVARHVPEHDAKLVELHAGHPVGAITPEADHADLGDIGVIDRRHPADLGHGPRIRRAQLDLDAMDVDEFDFAAVAPQTLAFEQDQILCGGSPWREIERRSFRSAVDPGPPDRCGDGACEEIGTWFDGRPRNGATASGCVAA